MARYVKVSPREIETDFTVSSNGEPLELMFARQRKFISTIVDTNNVIIRNAHAWLRYLSGLIGTAMTESSVIAYGQNLAYFCNWLETSNRYPNIPVDLALEIFNRRDIVDYHSASNVAGTTKHSREAVLKEFVNYLSRIDGNNIRDVEDSPWGRTDELGYVAKRGNKKSPKIITPEHIIEILNSMHNECERCMFHTQYDTGLRIAELIHLKVSDLPPKSIYENQSFEFIPMCIRGVKGRGTGEKERITLISRAVLNRIRKYHQTPDYKLAPAWKTNDPDKPVFLTSNQKRWKERNASKQFKSAVLRSKINENFVTHWMRHGTAFSVLNSDGSQSYTDKMLFLKTLFGHSHLSTTEIYTQIDPVLLANFSKNAKKINRLEEAEKIRLATYLAPLKHSEKRGHHNI